MPKSRATVPLRPSDIGGALFSAPRPRGAKRSAIATERNSTNHLLSGEGAQGDPSNEGVKITTIHSAKGLQFRAVLLVWADLLPTHYPDRDETQERSLFYVVSTRAEDVLAVTCSGSSRYVDDFQKAILQARTSPNATDRCIVDTIQSAAADSFPTVTVGGGSNRSSSPWQYLPVRTSTAPP